LNFALFSLKGHAVVVLHLLMMLARCCWDPVVGVPGMLLLLLVLLLAERMADKTAGGSLMRVKHLLVLLLSGDVQSEQMLAPIGGRS